MAKKEMTRRQLIAACRRADAKKAAEHRRELDALMKAMGHRRFSFYPWEQDEVMRLVHGAYGRMMLKSRTR